MAFGTPVISVSKQIVGGPTMIGGQVAGQTGDISIDIDLSAYLSEIKSALAQVSGVSTNVDVMDYITVPSTLSLTLPLNSAAISHVGSANLSTGHTWGTGNETFSINVNGAGAQTVTLNTNTTNVATTVSEINAELATAGVTGVEAYASGVNVGIRTTSAVPNQSIVLAEGTGALARLGWTAATYSNPSTDINVHFSVLGN